MDRHHRSPHRVNVDDYDGLDAVTQVEWVSARIDALHERLAVLYQLRRGAMLAMRVDGHTHAEIARRARIARSNVGRILSGGEPPEWAATIERLQLAERLLGRYLADHELPAGCSLAERTLAALIRSREDRQPSQNSVPRLRSVEPENL